MFNWISRNVQQEIVVFIFLKQESTAVDKSSRKVSQLLKLYVLISNIIFDREKGAKM